MSVNSEELYKKLDQYHCVLNQSTLNYLKNLISLQHSVLEEKTILEERGSILQQFDFYQEVLEYNIYHRALKVIDSMIDSFSRGERIQIESAENEKSLTIKGKIEQEEFSLFSYDSKEIEGKPTNWITLYESVRDLEQRELQKSYVLQQLNRLYNKKALTEYNDGENYQLCMRIRNQIEYYEKERVELEEHENLTDTDRQKIQMQEDFCKRFLNDYQMKKEGFKDETNLSGRTYAKKMVKTYPSITVTRYVRYI